MIKRQIVSFFASGKFLTPCGGCQEHACGGCKYYSDILSSFLSDTCLGKELRHIDHLLVDVQFKLASWSTQTSSVEGSVPVLSCSMFNNTEYQQNNPFLGRDIFNWICNWLTSYTFRLICHRDKGAMKFLVDIKQTE